MYRRKCLLFLGIGGLGAVAGGGRLEHTLPLLQLAGQNDGHVDEEEQVDHNQEEDDAALERPEFRVPCCLKETQRGFIYIIA